MPLQTQALAALALGERNNEPQTRLQHPLIDGVHLRWTFRRERGFPWHGYYLFRRVHRPRHDGGIGPITSGWEILEKFRYPLCLPVAHPDYPCVSKPVDQAAAAALAVGRIQYGDPADWAPAFEEIHETLEVLVENGPPPTGLTMADREYTVSPTDPSDTTPDTQLQRPLDIALLAALHPAIAQLLGLYFIDSTAKPGTSYDYIVLADFDGALGGAATSALSWLTGSPSFAEVDAWVVSDVRADPAPPLEPPEDLRGFVLPGLTIPSGDAVLHAFGNIGLRWDLRADALGALTSDAPVMYHLWRSELGSSRPTSEPEDAKYQPRTEKRPILVTQPALPGLDLDSPAHWPPERMYKVDRALAEGWYSYRVSGIDIFGRHSRLGVSAEWFQWAPAPDPRPWYYEDPEDTRAIHGYAIQVSDKTPPPAPTGIEAFALDPADPTVVRDAMFHAWHDTLSEAERSTVVGLRVRWRWPRSHQEQAPDVREFRTLCSSSASPSPGVIPVRPSPYVTSRSTSSRTRSAHRPATSRTSQRSSRSPT